MRAGLLACSVLALVACGGGGEDDDTADATAPSSPATDPAGSGTDPDGPTTAGPGGATEDTGSGPGTGDETDTGGSGPPPPECGPLTTCGVTCVDLMTDPANCGKCGVSCVIPDAAPACVAGTCAVATCETGFSDCDGDVNNGCEASLPPGMTCPFMCDPATPEQCNLLDDNCNMQCDEGPVAGCRQPVHRAVSPTLGHFYTVDANEAMSGDFTPEALNFFHTYVAQVPGTVPLYRCLKGNGRRFYTTDANCEGAGPSEGILGHVAGDASCGAIPLFRLFSGASQDHFYTVSEAERDAAVANSGYAYESVAGYVWPGP